ncbi:MAG: VanZ family protein [Chitinophagaceae bacterium]
MKKVFWKVIVLASLLMLLIPDFHPERFYSNGYHEWLDILQHSGYFFAFTIGVLWVFPACRRFFPFYFLIIGVSVILEIAQQWIPKRSFALMDMGSNILGITLAYLCWWAISRLRARSRQKDDQSDQL